MPILPGKKQIWLDMMAKLKEEPMKSTINASRNNAGVHERSFLQETPHGDFVIITMEGDNPMESFGKIMADSSMEQFNWTEFAKEVHGLDLDGPPPAMPTLVYDSQA